MVVRIREEWEMIRPRMFGDDFEHATILRTPHGSSGLKACEQQSRHHEKCHYDAGGVRRRGEQNSERGQNEQGSSRLDSPPRSFAQRSFTAEPLWCGGIVPMAVGPTHEIVQTINASSGGAIHTVIPIQKPKLFFITCSDVFAISIVDPL